MTQDADENLLEFVDVLNQIAVSNEKIIENSNAMSDSFGGVIEY